MPNRILKLDNSTNQGDVELDLGSSPYSGPYAELWIETDIAFNTACLTAINATNSQIELLQVYSSDASNQWHEIEAFPASNIFRWYCEGRAGFSGFGGHPVGGAFTPSPAVASNKFYRLKYHLIAGTPITVQIWVDGTSLGTISTNSPSIDATLLEYIDLETIGISAAGAFTYFGNLLIGTTEGGT